MSEVSNQIMSNQMDLNAMLLQSMSESSSKIKDSVPQANAEVVYAKKGETNYDEAMDADSNGTITYDEYMEYCKQNAVATSTDSGKTVIEKDPESATVRTISVGRAMEAYSKTGFTMPEAKIESEA